MSISDLLEKCELSNKVALQWWLNDVELHLESVGRVGTHVLKWYTENVLAPQREMEELNEDISSAKLRRKKSSSALEDRMRIQLKKKALWKPSVGDQVEARWAGGKDPQFTGWYIAQVTKLHRKGNRIDKVSLRYVDGSLDTDVLLKDIRKRSVGAVRSVRA